MLELDGAGFETLIRQCHEQRAADEWTADEPVAAPTNCDPPRLKVLLVEDDADDSMLVERCLDHMAHYEPQITVAGTLVAARFAFISDDFDVILLSDGLRSAPATELLAAFGDPLERCPVLVLTGYLPQADQALAVPDDAPACLAKSVLSPKVLETRIRQVLRTHAQHCTLMSIAAVPQGAG